MNPKRYTPLLIAAAMIFAGCHRNNLPDGVIDHEQMAAFMADVFTLEAFNNYAYPTDTDTLNLEVATAYDELLASHNLTKKQAEASMEYYSHHPEEYEKVLQIVLNDFLEDNKIETPPEVNSISHCSEVVK